MHSANVAVTSVLMVSVAYLFSKKGVISFEKGDEDTIMEAALEAGAEDVVTYDDGAMMSTLHGKKWAKYATLWKRQV
ncbi:YebC/PmpR family DNA-binding regulatory protein [Escherichia coli]|uniref:YebC/PmpR family DNA-binding regulatory protein n=1 Tax=Escherichia coli TaxID=562 RepID=A0A376W8Z1_ECOLX|nr:YebC/PmpR family DNA-binding regulatory protein [Escherichia coli]